MGGLGTLYVVIALEDALGKLLPAEFFAVTVKV
jgi:hypothetical protein